MPNLPFSGYYLTAALLVGCTVVGIIVAARFRREVDEDLTPTTKKDLLAPLEKAYYSGLMHPEEIERIRESVQKTDLAARTPPRPPARPAAGGDSTSILLLAGGSAADVGTVPADGGNGEVDGGS